MKYMPLSLVANYRNKTEAIFFKKYLSCSELWKPPRTKYAIVD